MLLVAWTERVFVRVSGAGGRPQAIYLARELLAHPQGGHLSQEL